MVHSHCRDRDKYREQIHRTQRESVLSSVSVQYETSTRTTICYWSRCRAV